MHRNIIVSGLILVALMAATAVAWGQEWEVRTFLNQTGNPDDPTCTDGSGTATASYQYLQSNIRNRWVCPLCSFSRSVGGTCPNPWNVPGHPSVDLIDMNASLRQRLLSITGQDMPDGKFDLNIVDIGGALHPRSVMGRPFKPFDLDTATNHNLRRSRLYAQAANIVSTGSPITAGMHLRFMVIPPTPLRREAQSNDPTGQDNGLPNRRPMAQLRPYDADDAATTVADDPATPDVDENALDLSDDSWLQLLDRAGNAQDITPADLPNFLEVGLNPYRVDDGDYWWVRYREEAVDLGGGVIEVRRAAVEIYSVMYGWQGQMVGGAKAELVVAPAWDDANGNGVVDAGEADVEAFDVVVPSGAVKLRFHTPFSGVASAAGGWNTWTMGFMTRSNCRMVPGWQDMAAVDDSDYPQFRGLDGVLYGDNTFKLAEDDPTTNDQFGPASDPVKTPSFAATSGTGPIITTETDIEGPAGAPQGYVLPPNTTGMGTIAVQWAGDLPDDAEWDPDPTVAAPAGTVFTLRPPADLGDTTAATRDKPYAEWQYDTGKNVTNAEIMPTQVSNYSSTYPYVQMMAARFMCTKPDVLPTGDTWDRNFDGTGDEAAEASNLDIAYPKALIGWLGSDLVWGAFAPGGTTPQRPLGVVNRWDGAAQTDVCMACGGIWADRLYPLPAEPLPQGLQQTTLPSDGKCPYHTNPAFVTVTGAGSADYNGTYYQTGTFNAQPVYELDTNHVLYYKGSRWTLAASTVSADAYRTQAPKAPLTAATVWQKRPAGNNPAPSSVVKSVTGSATTVASPVGGGGFTAGHDTWRAITATGQDERQASLPDKRHVLPGQAVVGSAAGVGTANDYASAQPEQLSVSIPRYQPPSVPGTGVVNNFALDQGYRGGEVLYQNVDAPNANAPMTDGWDVFYKNPDNGYFQPRAGEWPFLVNGSVVFAASAPAGSFPAEGRHFYCAVCGSEFRNNPNMCPFDGHTIAGTDQIPYNLAVREEHLVAEEYDPFDLQVSVARKGEVAQTTEDVPVGRVTPGVPSRQPDLNTGILNGHRAFPSDVSFVPRSPYRASEAKVLLRNEGNVQTPLRLANVYDLNDAAIADRALDHYLRVDVDPTSSYGRKASSGPLTRDTFVSRSEGDLGQIYENAMDTAVAWNTLATAPGSAAGSETYGYVSAGSYVGRGTPGTPNPKPVPLGQPVGTYSGSHLQYIDAIANGAFDFSYWDGSGWVDTTTATRQYNPAIDLAREPLTGVLRGQSRVFESRLPQNDYYARDSDPVVLPSPQPGRMQVIWSTNRLATSGASPSGAVGTNQGDIPTTTAASNLVYTTPQGYIDVADDPLFRLYAWPFDTSTALLNPPEVLTSDTGSVVNAAPWVMYDATGANKWAFWQRQQRHAGGVDSRLMFNSVAADTWTWPATPASNFVYDTGLMKQGLRGFARSTGAWLFWHAGTPGREQLNYRWDFTGTPNNNQALLPVASAMGAGTTDLATAVLPDGTNVTIRRPKSSPFTATKDVSVFNTGTTAHAFFSGFITHEGQADICWTQYRINDPIPAGASGPLSKLPFRRAVDDEELDTDGFHQLFGSRHLDWQVGQQFAYLSDRQSASFDGFSPTFELRLAFSDGSVRRFDVIWDLPAAERDRAVADYRNRGFYRVTPLLRGIGGATLPADYIIDDDGDGIFYLRDPNGPATRRLMVDINPVAGTVQFGAPLFDEDTPGNPRTALGDDAARAGLENLRNVALCANYNAYVYRVTRNGAQDDCPSASWDEATQRLVVFWRRSYPTSEAPHFGRPAFMYKAYSTSVQVGRPPVTSWDSVTGNTAAYVTANNPGILTADAGDIGRYLTINYTSADGRLYSERHQVIGWSREIVVPVDTVVGEGSLVAVPEQFNVPATDPADPNVLTPAVRYWLFWSSPRGVWDMRLVENPAGTRATGPYDAPVHPSSDIYTAVVAPEFGSLAPERAIRAVPVP